MMKFKELILRWCNIQQTQFALIVYQSHLPFSLNLHMGQWTILIIKKTKFLASEETMTLSSCYFKTLNIPNFATNNYSNGVNMPKQSTCDKPNIPLFTAIKSLRLASSKICSKLGVLLPQLFHILPHILTQLIHG